MVTTVKVIFLGLIGFVPSPEGQNDIAALLVDPAQVEYPETECPIPEHISMVILLHGQCESSHDICCRMSHKLRGQAEGMGLDGFRSECPQLFEKGKNIKNQGEELPSLVWFLEGEDLDITGDGDEDLDLRNPLLALTRAAAPQSAQQSTYFSWVPSMDELTNGQGQIRTDCRQGNPRCPLNARFMVEGGEIGACHMYHDLSNSQGKEREVRIFDYLIPGQNSVQRRAVADAVQVEFHEEDNSVVLESRNLPGLPPRSIKAVLSPDKDGRLTLIVANLPPCMTDSGETSPQHYCHHAHSDVLFQLLKKDQITPPVRVMNEERQIVDPGPCEKEIQQLPPLFGGCLLEYPHAITACDGTRFPKPSQ